MDKTALLKKVRALAERGVGGEKDAAAKTLEKLMKKYGISDEELAEETAERVEFKVKDWIENKLIQQVIYMVLGDVPIYEYKDKRKKNIVFTDCTPAERLEIETAFHFYNNYLKEDFELFYTAFLHTNHIFPPESKVKSDGKPPRERSKQEIFKMAQFMQGMEAHTIHKMIEARSTKEGGQE